MVAPVLDTLNELRGRMPRLALSLISYADDITARVRAEPEVLLGVFPDMIRTAIYISEGLLDMRISRGPRGKSSCLLSDASMKESLGEELRKVGMPVAEESRWLGVDCPWRSGQGKHQHGQDKDDPEEEEQA